MASNTFVFVFTQIPGIVLLSLDLIDLCNKFLKLKTMDSLNPFIFIPLGRCRLVFGSSLVVSRDFRDTVCRSDSNNK